MLGTCLAILSGNMDYTKIQVSGNVLVLNSDYNPINICEGRRAIVLLLKRKAQFISDKVIRLLNYIRIPFTKIMSHRPSRNMIHKRDQHICQYCGAKENLTVDHVLPSSRGGRDEWENLVCCCTSCNMKKGNKTPEEAGMKLKKQPKAPFNKVHLAINSFNNSDWNQYVYS
jgi:5-methylcytosine-specific restriction endonuclease McrA